MFFVNQSRERQALFTDVNEIWHINSKFLFRFVYNSVKQMSMKIY